MDTATRIAFELRWKQCTHGCPERVYSDRPLQGKVQEKPWCKPLCDTCTIEVVRAVLGQSF